MRGFNAVVNLAIREANRQHRIQQREAERRRREAERQDKIKRGTARISEFNGHLESLRSLHKGFENPTIAVCRIYPHGEDIIPKARPNLLENGKISERSLSKTDFHQFYMDYVCSASLRMARESFALLPLHSLVLNVIKDHLNEATGHTGPEAILSLIVSRDDLDQLDFNHIRPSAAITTLTHRVAFQKTKGFKTIKPFETDDVKRLDSSVHE